MSPRSAPRLMKNNPTQGRHPATRSKLLSNQRPKTAEIRRPGELLPIGSALPYVTQTLCCYQCSTTSDVSATVKHPGGKSPSPIPHYRRGTLFRDYPLRALVYPLRASPRASELTAASISTRPWLPRTRTLSPLRSEFVAPWASTTHGTPNSRVRVPICER